MSKFGTDLVQSRYEALAHAPDEDSPGITINLGAVDANVIRKKLDLKQDEMATLSRPTWFPSAEGGGGLFYSPDALVRFVRNRSRRRWYLRVISAEAWPSCFWT